MKVDDYNLYLFNEGKLNKAYDIFGSHIVKNDDGSVKGTIFRVYAPNAKIVSVVGDFNNWDSRINVMNRITNNGIFELFIEGIKEWTRYKYAILTYIDEMLYKADPYAFFSDNRPDTCSKVYDIDGFNWTDSSYMKKRPLTDHLHSPITIYEMNIGSWMKKPDGSFNKYNELPRLLIPYLKKMGFNTVEFMPLIEFPLDESWGYQGTGYYSITSRYGVPKDFMYLVDELHKENIKVILDWVPGHICKDEHSLYAFDGSHLYEYEDSFRRENIVWGTANLDFKKGHTKSYMLSNVMFFMEYFHIDGFRLDAVSNIYYFLGDENNGENVDGINFLKDLSLMVKEYDPEVILSAEDSTIFPNVTKPVKDGGIGFDYKWNMGWMNDSLKYFEKDPIYRKYHHNLITFSLIYAYSEHYILPLSHDEVVHGKHSLIDKMSGDYWQKFASYRALLGFMYTHPGKKLLFMGGEFGQFHEWKDKEELDWFLLQYEKHSKMQKYVSKIQHIYLSEDALNKGDDDKESFKWIDPFNNSQSVFIYERIYKEDRILVVLNLTPNAYPEFRVGVSIPGTYKEILNSDMEEFGGSNLYNGLPLISENIKMHEKENSINITLSPLSVSIFKLIK